MSARNRRAWHGARIGVALVLGIGLSGCSATYRDHGYIPAPDQLDEIQVGVDTRDSVIETVGSPSSSGVLRPGEYYYVSSRIRNFAWRAPEIVEREVVAISFDQRGVVRNIERFGLEDGNVVPLSRRVTDDGVTDTTFLRQLLGNLGRFTPGQFLE